MSNSDRQLRYYVNAIQYCLRARLDDELFSLLYRFGQFLTGDPNDLSIRKTMIYDVMRLYRQYYCDIPDFDLSSLYLLLEGVADWRESIDPTITLAGNLATCELGAAAFISIMPKVLMDQYDCESDLMRDLKRYLVRYTSYPCDINCNELLGILQRINNYIITDDEDADDMRDVLYRLLQKYEVGSCPLAFEQLYILDVLQSELASNSCSYDTLSSVNLGVVLTLFAPAYNVVSQNHAVELVFGKALRQVYVEAGRLRLKGEKERAVVLQECGTAIAKDAHAFFCLSSRERKAGIKNFQKMSRTRIYAASEVGKKDAGVKKVVGNLLLAVAGLGIFYGVAVGVHYKRTKCVGFFARKSLPEPLRDVHRVVGELSKSIPRCVAEDRTVVPVSRCV